MTIMTEGSLKDDSEVPAPPPSEIGGVDESFDDSGVKFKFKRLLNRVPGEAWISMVYGSSKTGKTYYAGTAGSRTLYINIGEGTETLMSPGFTQARDKAGKLVHEGYNPIIVDIREAPDVATAFDMTTDTIDFALKHFPEKFDTVVMDEATSFRKFALNKAMDLNTNARTKSTRGDRRTEYVKADIGDYGTEMDMIEWFLGEYIPIFKGANKHFLMLAHERQIYQKPPNIGDEAVLKRVVPGFTGKTFPDKVPAFFDDVFRSEVILDGASNAQYRLRCAGNVQELGGTRHGGIFNVTEVNPDFLNMLDRIKKAQPRKK